MTGRDYEGDPLDLSWQDIKDRPYKGEGETVDVTSEGDGTVSTEGVEEALGEDPDTDDLPSEEELQLVARHGGSELTRTLATVQLARKRGELWKIRRIIGEERDTE